MEHLTILIGSDLTMRYRRRLYRTGRLIQNYA